jgi:hypothetical protein
MDRVRKLASALGARFVVLALAVALSSGMPDVARAQGASEFGVRTAYMQIVEGVYLLNARLRLPIDERLRAALADGVALTLELEIEVNGVRRYWTDETVASLVQRYQLQYHAVSERYLVRNLNSGEQDSFPNLDAAVEHLTRISGLPVLDQTLISKRRRYEASLRATLDVGDMPYALRMIMFWVDDFHRSSEWYTWPLLQ